MQRASMFAAIAGIVLALLGASNLRAQPAGHTVEILGEDYRPFDLTIAAGDTVTWVNDGGAAHNIRSADGLFASPFLRDGASFSHTFASAGDYRYRCGIHPFMVGVIRVTGDGVTPRPAVTVRLVVPALARGASVP